ncbi:MAG: heme-copper oxidase subunit III [Gammaproteobacteria bacterium]|nr:heme-copper oxidase subunit III [Gammaproteobacteria bacterium]
MAENATTHEAHWDTSTAPLVISLGILFLCLAFIVFFVYHSGLAAIISLGIGTPLIIGGIVIWVNETIDVESEGLSVPSMGWFILAEAMIFMSLFANYWLQRLLTPDWPPAGTPAEMPVAIPLIMTVLLVSSSFTIHAGEARLENDDRAGFVKWLAITMLLGAAFLGMSLFEWGHLVGQGFNVSTNVYSTSFYSITGFHASHVLVGLCIFLTMLLPAMKNKVNSGLVKAGALYWHFVDIIWFFVVSQVYFW